MPSKIIYCPVNNCEVSVCRDCSECEKSCNKILLAILDDCQNINEIISLNDKVTKALQGREATIITNREFEGAAEVIADNNNCELLYSWAKDKKFGNIPEIVSKHQKAIVIFTKKETCDSFVEEIKKYKLKRSVQIKLWNL